MLTESIRLPDARSQVDSNTNPLRALWSNDAVSQRSRVPDMFVVIGDLCVREGSLDAAVTLSREHVERSRRETGCISHDVHHHVADA